MRVRFKNDYQVHKAGSVAEVPDEKARMLIGVGGAEEFRSEGTGTMRVRFRRSHSVGGSSYAGGALIDLPEADGWPLVNQGIAECDPPPGVRGQPFPPPEVTEDPVPEPTPARGVPPATLKKEPGRKNTPPLGEEEPKPAGPAEPHPRFGKGVGK